MYNGTGPGPLGVNDYREEGPGCSVDVFSHFLLPLAGALVVLRLGSRPHDDPERMIVWRQRLALALVFGFAGLMVDLDGIYGWLRHQEGLYFLQHRGFSHSLLGAPLHGLVAAGLVALAARLFPKRLSWLHWRAAYIPTAVLGSFTHLGLDALTFGGVPLWWPITPERVSLDVYSWLIIWMVPPAGIISVLFLLGKLSTRRVIQFTTVLVVLMVINAGMRLQERPELTPGEKAYSRSSYQQWIVLTPDPDDEEAWWVQLHDGGQPHGPQWFNQTHIEPGSEAAVRHAEDTNTHRGFRMNTFGPIVTETRALEDGDWAILFTAVVPRMDALNDPRWTPTQPETRDWGLQVLHVKEDRVETIQAGW